MAYKFISGSEDKFLEQKYVKWEEVGLTGPDRAPGTIWTWGYNYGNLGLNDLTHRSSPAQVGSLTTWSVMSMGASRSFSAIRIDGTLWTWGENAQGQLGLGDTAGRSSPVQVGSLTNWAYTCSGGTHTLAIKTDGTLWAFGNNENSKLGLGDTTNRSSPVQVGSLTNWKEVYATQSGSYGITTTGSLYAWGNLAWLSAGTTPNLNTAISNIRTMAYHPTTLAHYHAIKNDGTLWAIGYNTYGQLGKGTTGSFDSTWIQIGSDTNWRSIASSDYSTIATRTNNTLWVWGYNAYYNLGLSDTFTRNSPTQLGALTNWKKASILGVVAPHGLAVKTDGTLWSWGNNGFGQLGLGDRTNKISPVQVGTLTNWKNTTAVYYGAVALKYNY